MAARLVAVTLSCALAAGLLGACGGGGGDGGGVATATVSGRVVCATDGGGVEGAAVSLGTASANTARDGRYTLSGIAPGRHSVSVACEGYVQPGAPLSVDILAGSNALDPIVVVPATEMPPEKPSTL
ncbi:MAG: carboxypeptidase-like regulatory domain-containing protein [Armatimonadota bacterium]